MSVLNSDVLKGKWQQLKGEARVQWGRLTDDDLDQIQGNAEKRSTSSFASARRECKGGARVGVRS